MIHSKSRCTTSLLAAGGLALAALLAGGTAMAAGKTTSPAQQQYKEDRAKCMRGETNQDRATCLKEAGAALQEANQLSAGSKGELARNRIERCQNLPAADRESCIARMTEGTTSGSAQQGGILREVTQPTK